MVECDCADWGATMPMGKGLVLYGRRIKYCPWCGKPIEYDGPLAEELYVEVLYPHWIDQEDKVLRDQLGW